jgi:hypothetical protein
LVRVFGHGAPSTAKSLSFWNALTALFVCFRRFQVIVVTLYSSFSFFEPKKFNAICTEAIHALLSTRF